MRRTIGKTLVVLLQVCLRTLTPGTDGHCVVLERAARRRELVQVRAGVVVADDEEADTVWPPTVLLRVHLSLCAKTLH